MGKVEHSEDQYEDESMSDDDDNNDSHQSDVSEDEAASGNEEESGDEQACLRKELADVPLGEIQKLKETVSLKKYNEAIFGVSKTHRNNKQQQQQQDEEGQQTNSERKTTNKVEEVKEKKKKSAPEEMTSKRRNYKPRTVIEETKKKSRDPRFDSLSGELNTEIFQKAYSFVDDMKKEELEIVKKQFKKAKNKERKGALHKLLQRMEQQDKLKTVDEKRKGKERERKKEEYAEGKISGKKTFHLKKSDARKLEMVEQYKELEKSGQLDRYMNKKRKHNAAKEKKKLPPIK